MNQWWEADIAMWGDIEEQVICTVADQLGVTWTPQHSGIRIRMPVVPSAAPGPDGRDEMQSDRLNMDGELTHRVCAHRFAQRFITVLAAQTESGRAIACCTALRPSVNQCAPAPVPTRAELLEAHTIRIRAELMEGAQ